jgi:hypothetical protein
MPCACFYPANELNRQVRQEHAAAVRRNHSRFEQEVTEKTEFLDNEWMNLAANSVLFLSVSSVTSCSRFSDRSQAYLLHKQVYEIFAGRKQTDG